MTARRTASKTKTKTKTKPKSKSRSKAPRVRQLTSDEAAARVSAGQTLKGRLAARFSGYADKLLEQAEQDPDKLIAGAAQLLNNTEKLVAAVKGDPEGAKRVLRNGVISLAAGLVRASRERTS